MHGHEGCAKNWSNDNDKLHAGMHAIKCENAGGVLISFKPKLEPVVIDTYRSYLDQW